MKLPPLILASPRRAELLRQLQPEFQIVTSDAEEILDGQMSPLELCQLNAHRKARAVAKKIPDSLVLGGHREHLFVVSTEVMFRPLTAGQIGSYHSKMNPLDTAGAYAIQEHGDMIVFKISRSLSNGVGLPVERLKVELSVWAT